MKIFWTKTATSRCKILSIHNAVIPHDHLVLLIFSPNNMVMPKNTNPKWRHRFGSCRTSKLAQFQCFHASHENRISSSEHFMERIWSRSNTRSSTSSASTRRKQLRHCFGSKRNHDIESCTIQFIQSPCGPIRQQIRNRVRR